MKTPDSNPSKPTHIIDPQKFIEKEVAVKNKLAEKRQSAFDRFPLPFALLGGFGLVATFYGFEHLIDRVDLLADNPAILLATGILTLIITGTLYKKLG